MQSMKEKAMELFKIDRPFAITMWEFSWIERRWPGAGYEDWDQALTELTDRGYDAVRIDPYPQLIALSDTGSFALDPVWEACGWGSIKPITVSNVLENLLEFLRLHPRVGRAGQHPVRGSVQRVSALLLGPLFHTV